MNLKTIVISISLAIILILGIWGLGDALVPLIFAFGLSYLLFPIVKKLEAKGISRSYSVPALLSFVILLIVLVFALILPSLISDGKNFLTELPVNSAKAIEKLELASEEMGYDLNLSKESISLYIREHISQISGGLLKSFTKGLKTSFAGIANWIIAILNLFLIPLFFFYVINDYEKLSHEIKSYIPKSLQPKIAHYSSLMNTVLSGYIRGQLMVALALSALYAIGLSIVGLKFGLLIGIASGLISIIPYAGFTLGFITAIIIGLANYSGMGEVVGIVIVFVIVQALEGFVITPKLVGDKVGLSALATILVLIIGGNLFGLMGMLIAIPLAAVIKSVIAELKQELNQANLL